MTSLESIHEKKKKEGIHEIIIPMDLLWIYHGYTMIQ